MNNELNTQDPLGSFRFSVTIEGITYGIFTECTLPDIAWDVQEVIEGGLNSYTHQLPGRRKGSKVTLKKGLVKEPLLQWYLAIMSERFENLRKTVEITLFNSVHRPIFKWSCEGAYPTKWTGPSLNAGENAVAIQTLELACAEVTFQEL